VEAEVAGAAEAADDAKNPAAKLVG
jgi:hypothetical protein